ncbi:SCO family protein [Sedimentitalea sp. HM32M-2]|uniref:SCO family protein n=1 Tax=Sedimentitalea sp. HM32M-2 TaxID=3351566 RepID=UPI00363AD640
MKILSLLATLLLATSGAWAVIGSNAEGKAAIDRNFSSAFPASDDFQFDPPAAGSYALNRIKSAPDGRVLGIDGQQRALNDILSGKISLVSFVYLNCGETNGCPLAMSTLFDLYHTSAAVPQLRDELQLLTISFDPDRDTVEAIETFAYPITHDQDRASKLDWRVLTTQNLEQLDPILKGFGQVVERSNDQEQISHLLRIFLVDREGEIRNIYGLGLIDPRLIMTDVETLLIEEGRL